jgi:phage regulator Rha-like protein
MQEIIPIERIESKILTIRNQQVMLDRDLAELYEVETKTLTRAVRRNIDRFPDDFMFQLNYKEFTDLKYQFGTSSWGGTRKLPLAFTENGVAMLSTVLRSQKAIQVNIQIMRAFNYLKRRYLEEKEVDKKIDILAKKHDEDVTFIFMELDRLDRLIESRTNKKQIGFKKED